VHKHVSKALHDFPSEDIEDLSQMELYLLKDILACLEPVKISNETQLDNIKIACLKRELEQEKEKQTDLEEKLLKLECQSKRVNLKFFGIKQKVNETPKDCKNLLLSLFEQVGLKFLPRVIQRHIGWDPRQMDQEL
jgi:hypothetical protein